MPQMVARNRARPLLQDHEGAEIMLLSEIEADKECMKRYRRYFRKEIEIIRPHLIVAMGERTYRILKDWLVRVLVSLSRRGAESLNRKDVEAHAPSVAQCDKMLSEAVEGEVRLSESTEERNRLRTRLGLSAIENSGGDAADSAIKIAAPTRNPLKPGQRRPVRDAVGTASSMDANGSRL